MNHNIFKAYFTPHAYFTSLHFAWWTRQASPMVRFLVMRSTPSLLLLLLIPCTSDLHNPPQLPYSCLLACVCVWLSSFLSFCFDKCMVFFFFFTYFCLYLYWVYFRLHICSNYFHFSSQFAAAAYLLICLSIILVFHSFYISLNIFLYFNEYVFEVNFTNINSFPLLVREFSL